MKVSAKANANIALIKYWGKRDKALMLPHNSSLSVTLDGLFAHTTVEKNNDLDRDQLFLNDEEIMPGTEDYDDYVGKFLKHVRTLTDEEFKLRIKSVNNFPTAAGLASSAAGFAALAKAVSEVLDLGLDDKNLSMLARRGSGSATRSIHSGFVRWNKGEMEDGSDSYAEQLHDKNYWSEFRILACITTKKEKKIKSRAGMSQTVASSPFYPNWLSTVDEDRQQVEQALEEKDISKLGQVAENNALKMHSTMITTEPTILYWNPTTVELMHRVMDMRDEGIECYFTIDGGPQIKIITLDENIEKIKEKIQDVAGIERIEEIKVGKGVEITSEHLF